MKNLVWAGNYHQYEQYLRENNLNRQDYRYIATNKDLFGYRPHSVNIFRIGTWYEKANISIGLIENLDIQTVGRAS